MGLTNFRFSCGDSVRFASRALLIAALAFALGACCGLNVPASTCPSGQVALGAGTTYAAYQSSTGKYQLEDTTMIGARCIAPVIQPLSSTGSTSESSTCGSGTSALKKGTIWGAYYSGKDIGKHTEDTAAVIDRCIVEIGPNFTNPCPAGKHEVFVGNQSYCVRN